MKTTITISLDQEIIMQLKKEINYSDLINEQMKAFYNVKGCENIEILKQNLAKTKQIIKENNKKRREIEAKLIKVKAKEKEILEISKKKLNLFTEDQIKWLKKQENLDYETALDFVKKNKLMDKFNIGGIKLIKLWEEVKHGAV